MQREYNVARVIAADLGQGTYRKPVGAMRSSFGATGVARRRFPAHIDSVLRLDSMIPILARLHSGTPRLLALLIALFTLRATPCPAQPAAMNDLRLNISWGHRSP